MLPPKPAHNGGFSLIIMTLDQFFSAHRAKRLLSGAAARAGFLMACLALAAPLAVPSSPAQAEDVQGIAAVVNDSVISRYDLEQRMRLVLSTSGIQPTDENVERVRQQVLRNLIDEKLQIQEAERLELSVSEEEVNEALERLASRSGRSAAEIESFLGQNGIDISTLRNQIYSELAWNKVIGRSFAPQISIGDQEVDEKLRQIEQESEQVQYRVSEIFLGFENPTQERDMREGATRLVQQLRGGMPFAAAAQFSQAASAAAGGDIGWVAASQLPEPIAQRIVNMSAGEISDPIRVVNGFYIIQVQDMQKGLGPNPLRNRFELVRLVLPLDENASQAAVNARARDTQTFMNGFKTCAAVPEQIQNIQGAEASPPVQVEAAQIQEPLRSLLQEADAGEVIKPQRTPQGIEIFILCNRWDDQGTKITRDSIEDNLFNQRLSMMARRHLRDLRRDAVVEMR